MSFSNAFKFPFRNFARAMQIVLIFAVFVVGLVAFARNAQYSSLNTFLSFVTSVTQGLILSGYGIRIIREMMRSDGKQPTLPQFEFLHDTGRGVAVGIATIIHMIPTAIASFSLMSALFAIGASNNYYSTRAYDSSSDTALVLIAGFALLVMLPLIIFPIMTLLVGMMRYAAEERTAALFEMGKNWSLVRANMGQMRGLILRQFAFWFVYLIVTGIVQWIFIALFWNVSATSISDTGHVTINAVVFIVLTTISIFHQFSTTHLIAQRAETMGIGARKSFDGGEKIKRHQPGINPPRPDIRSI